jgi:hypothetical protein
MVGSKDWKERFRAVNKIQDNIANFLDDDKKMTWDDLIRLTSDADRNVRWEASNALGSAFSFVPDKKQAWEDLIRLTSDTDSVVHCRAADMLASFLFLLNSFYAVQAYTICQQDGKAQRAL